ncbi:hypothetical protein NCCP1664_19720 [Zafaria cholistanensis]|uniref:Uncharacterized protein n=1 Tax=Zafaria cholistanensis TaxID=1682741 RepID=A0A5A7NS65_9MICC|nr:Trp biosynthesis-associated membrane protein [Zafaria cholistanensis]GER23476.1 hypothetical protein NCCP1664_19720 [Zafaria cholistanensis]
MSSPPGGRGGARPLASRRNVLLAALLGAVVALSTTTRTWIRVVPDAASVRIPQIDVAGSEAATAVAALAVVALAGAVAAAIAGPVARRIIAVLLIAAGAGIAAASAGAALDPQGAAAGAVGNATGTPTVAGAYTVLAWPWIAAAAGAWMALAGMALFAAGRGWKGGRKYAAASGTAQPPGAALPEGTPQSEGTLQSEGGTRSGGAARPPADGPLDEIDGWDSLSRGEDPTG